jgi:hypothetical protein
MPESYKGKDYQCRTSRITCYSCASFHISKTELDPAVYLRSVLIWKGSTSNFITDKLGYISWTLTWNGWRKQTCGYLTKPTTKEGNLYEYMSVEDRKVASLLTYKNKGSNGRPLLLKGESLDLMMSSYPRKVNPKLLSSNVDDYKSAYLTAYVRYALVVIC